MITRRTKRELKSVLPIMPILTLSVFATTFSLAAPAFAQTDDNIVLAQDQDQDRDKDQDRDRDRDHLSNTDMDRLQLMLRDGSCEDVSDIGADDIDDAVQCLDRDRLRDGSCNDTISVDGTPLELLLLKCLDTSTN